MRDAIIEACYQDGYTASIMAYETDQPFRMADLRECVVETLCHEFSIPYYHAERLDGTRILAAGLKAAENGWNAARDSIAEDRF